MFYAATLQKVYRGYIACHEGCYKEKQCSGGLVQRDYPGFTGFAGGLIEVPRALWSCGPVVWVLC